MQRDGYIYCLMLKIFQCSIKCSKWHSCKVHTWIISVGITVMCFIRASRKDYITAKYVEHNFVDRERSNALHGIREAIQRHDLMALLQSVASGADLSKPLHPVDKQVFATLIRILHLSASVRFSLPFYECFVSPTLKGLCGISPSLCSLYE